MAGMVTVFVLALVVEAVWERIQDALPRDRIPDWVKVWVSVIFAAALCLYYRVDLVAASLSMLEEHLQDTLPVDATFSVVGAVLTGFLISRGSNFLHDFIRLIQNLKSSTKA